MCVGRVGQVLVTGFRGMDPWTLGTPGLSHELLTTSVLTCVK